MAAPRNKVVPHDEWIKARKRLLAKEKAFTHAREKLAAERRALPWERIGKEYVFDGPQGRQTLADLFEGRSQLIVYHFMFGPDWGDAGCPHCSRWADSFNGAIAHLNARDTSMVAVSRAPYAKLAAYAKRMGWSFKWMSSLGSDFNYDFNVAFTPDEVEKKAAFYNFAVRDPEADEREGVSVFFRDGKGRIFRTYSTYARGIDMMNVEYQYLDLTPKGRDERGKGPYWVQRHDEYETA